MAATMIAHAKDPGNSFFKIEVQIYGDMAVAVMQLLFEQQFV